MKTKLVIGAFASVLLLTGCMGTPNDEGRRGMDNPPLENTGHKDGVRDGGNLNRDITENTRNRNSTLDTDRVRDEDHYKVSSEAADRIVSEIPEIDSAYVLTSNRQAYVAAQLDNDQHGRNDGKNEGRRTETSDNNNRDNVGNVEDRNNVRNAIEDDRSDRNKGEGHEVTDEVKDKISDIIQSVDPDIKNVYVTTSPDFVDLVNNYSDDLDNGRPVRGFFDEIGNMIERVFPQNKR